MLNHTPWCYEGNCPFEWARTFLPLISDCIYREDYEAAKASTDAIREFLNRFLPPEDQITVNDKLRLPEIKDYLNYITRAATL